MFPTTAFLSLLLPFLPCLRLLLYRSRLLFPILLQFSNPVTLSQLRTLSLPLTLIFQLPSLASFPTNLRPSSLLRSVSRLLPALVPTMSVLSLSPNCCPVTQPLPSSSKPFPILPRLPPMPRLALPAALSNSAPISSITSLISIFSLSLMLLLLPQNVSLVRWLTQSLRLGQFLPLLTGLQSMTRTPAPSLCCSGRPRAPHSPPLIPILFIRPTMIISVATVCPLLRVNWLSSLQPVQNNTKILMLIIVPVLLRHDIFSA
jgi:hypothetical protein